ncbi:30S ribosomal protein S20 [Weissella viridescens]|uniref:Small ribosomal subunit protein bS20 n=1 Tax=Weissella viridescens TaxID=1629 RepID=A0A0R2GZ25_WEIVI|nr:30S ribosomal protein S20 [Weissella viridescens]KRN45704.1 30S ribosomal protein S20 [Weissella viridescens]MBX4173500.1 30S ribosomal protein S20 [Weissella viridescens]MCB6840885.1 30S ribosomal protein S20 [Weissella viridescens]MCB6847618.1 30S ribosomal protein S20 [Weissella viridescens]RRG17394.1 30S ribosomal protein S20 [Weissella viridescens]
MPIIESSIQRARLNKVQRERNVQQLSAYRTEVKKFRKAVEAGSDNANELFVNASSAIDRAASKGLISKNKASRDKSRLSALLNK